MDEDNIDFGEQAHEPSALSDASESGTFEFELMPLIRRLYGYKWMILTCALLGVISGALVIRDATPIYKTTMTLKYDPVASTTIRSSDDERAGWGSVSEELKTQVGIIQSPRMAQRVIEALGLDLEAETEHRNISPLAPLSHAWSQAVMFVSSSLISYDSPDIDPAISKAQKANETLRRNLQVHLRTGTKLIDITVSNSDPHQAARIAYEFGAQYIRLLNEEQTETLGYTLGWVKEQTDQAKDRLEQAERRLYAYNGEYDMRVMEQNLEIASNGLKALAEEEQRLERKIAVAQAWNSGTRHIASRRVLLNQDPEYAELTRQLEILARKQETLSAENLPAYPELNTLNHEINALRKQVRNKEDEIVEGIQGETALAMLELNRIQPLLDEKEKLVQQIQGEMIEYRVLQRDAESATQFYRALLDRSKEFDATAKIEPVNVTIVSEPTIPHHPDSPRVVKALALFLFSGTFVGIAIALLLHRLDRRVRNVRQLEQQLQVPTFGAIPYLGGGRLSALFRRQRGRVVRLPLLHNPGSKECEAFRSLRSALRYSTPGSPPQVILVASSVTLEGKSTVAANLALAFASSGAKTLLIDADLKAPSLHRMFEARKWPGLSEVVTGQVEIAKALRTTDESNCHLLTSGRATPSSLDLIESKVMKKLLDVLRDHYEVIIIDSVPILGMADTPVLSRIVDGTCLVYDHGRTSIDNLRDSVEAIRRMNGRLMGCVCNFTYRSIDASEQYGFQYGQAYGYGYGAERMLEEDGYIPGIQPSESNHARPREAVNGGAPSNGIQ